MKFYAKKIIGLIVTLAIVSVVTFGMFEVMSGNPAEIILGVDAEPEQIEALEKELMLDRPAAERYLMWCKNILKGDMGTSYKYHMPVATLIGDAFKVTFGLSVLSITLTVLIGVPMGILITKQKNKFLNLISSCVSQLGLSVPSFCVSMLLITIFSVWLKVLPFTQYVPFSVSPSGYFKSMIMPALAVSLGSSAVLMRYVKVCIENEKKQPYVKTARGKGLSENKILTRHILRNSLVPSVTMLGMLVADILGGSIIIENVFTLPGIGKLIASSVANRDLMLTEGLVLYLAAIVVLCNFLVDILYSVIDPRIRR